MTSALKAFNKIATASPTKYHSKPLVTSLDDNLSNLSLGDDSAPGGPHSPAQQLLKQLFEEVRTDGTEGLGGSKNGKVIASLKKSSSISKSNSNERDGNKQAKTGKNKLSKVAVLRDTVNGTDAHMSSAERVFDNSGLIDSYNSTEVIGNMSGNGMQSIDDPHLCEEEDAWDIEQPAMNVQRDEDEDELFPQLEGVYSNRNEDIQGVITGDADIQALVADVADVCVDKAASHVMNCTIERLEELLQSEQDGLDGSDLEGSMGSIQDGKGTVLVNGFKSVKSLKQAKA